MRICVTEPAGLAELEEPLTDASCLALDVAGDTVDVMHPATLDAREELIELTFFARARSASRSDVQVIFSYTIS